jgi:hypothetical protein
VGRVWGKTMVLIVMTITNRTKVRMSPFVALQVCRRKSLADRRAAAAVAYGFALL